MTEVDKTILFCLVILVVVVCIVLAFFGLGPIPVLSDWLTINTSPYTPKS